MRSTSLEEECSRALARTRMLLSYRCATALPRSSTIAASRAPRPLQMLVGHARYGAVPRLPAELRSLGIATEPSPPVCRPGSAAAPPTMAARSEGSKAQGRGAHTEVSEPRSEPGEPAGGRLLPPGSRTPAPASYKGRHSS